ncbi:MAG TPA: hypothetical protein VGE07_01480 [Herpetosiphonaceae bacterium]
MTDLESVPNDIVELMGEMTERHQQTLVRLLAEVGEAGTRELIAKAQHRLLHPKEPVRENSPKTVRAALWEIIHEELTPPMFTRVFDVKAPPDTTFRQWPWRRIALRLGEHDPEPQQQVREILVVTGLRLVEETVAEAERIFATGGMFLPGRRRRRTLGGIFFHLIKQKMTPSQMKYVPSWQNKPPPKIQQQPEKPLSPEDLLPVLEWAARKEIYREVLAEQGEGRTMKITLVGRPGRVVEKKDVVITSIKLEKKFMTPRGVPQPLPTTYSVYIGRKQWNKVKQVMDDPEDLLVLEGYASYDPDMEGIVVSVTTCTTRSIQLSKRPPKQQPAAEGAPAEPGEGAEAAEPAAENPPDAAPVDA